MEFYFKETFFALLTCTVFACSPVGHTIAYRDLDSKSASSEPSKSTPVQESNKPSRESVETQETRSSTFPLADLVVPTVPKEDDTAFEKEHSLSEENSLLSSSETLMPKKKERKDTQQIMDEALEFCQVSQDFWAQGDFENAIASLDQAYSLILTADKDEEPELIQQKDDIRFMICKRMLEVYASRHTVVNGNHDAIPMVMNEHVQKEIKLFKGPERRFFINSYQRSGRYRPEILKALKEAGLPEELSWLPLIESGFKINAMSQARALGLWQFIPSTGYKFGLKRDQWIDERMDGSKSTQAAIAYLKELHKIFGDWCTVLAGYNCGEARVLRVIRNQNINYLDNFWDLFKELPWETARYVPRFLAALFIINDPDRFGFDLPDPEPPLTYETANISKQVRLSDVAKVLDIPRKNLEVLNTELRYKISPPTAYSLKVPKGQGSILMARLDAVSEYTPPRRFHTYHRVRRGQTLSHLARRYRTSIRAIMLANNLRSQNYIRAGQTLKIPARHRGYVSPTASQMGGYPSSKPLRYRVQRGDSLWLLARRFNTNIRYIMRLNHLQSTRLHIGQTLVIRKGTDEVEAPAKTKSYRVKRGDSPYRIATQHNMELKRFLSLNNLTPRSKIYPGQVFLVKVQ